MNHLQEVLHNFQQVKDVLIYLFVILPMVGVIGASIIISVRGGYPKWK